MVVKDMQASPQIVMIPPQTTPAMIAARLQTFRVLLLSDLGRLVWFDCQGKAPPSEQFIADIRRRIDALAFDSERVVQIELTRIEYEHDIRFVHGDCCDMARWPLESWIQLQTLSLVANSAEPGRLLNLRAGIIEQSHEYLKARLAQFIKMLPADTAAVMPLAEQANFLCWNYVCHPELRLRRNRLQAIRSYPILVQKILLEDFADIRHAIDTEQPLEAALSHHFQVKAGLIRKVGHQALRELSGPFANIHTLLSLLDNIPLSAVPCSAEQWQHFKEISDRVAELLDQPVSTPLAQAVLAECLAKKEALKLVLSPAWHQHQNAVRQLLHALTSIAGFLYQGQFSPKEAHVRSKSLVGKFISAIGVKSLVHFAATWGATYRSEMAVEADRRNAINKYRWPALIPEPMTIGRFIVTPLANISSLTEEGSRMHNCVASYAADCKAGVCQIWSLKSVDTHVSATVQTFVDAVQSNTRPRILLGQIEGPGGKAADPALIAAARQLVAHLSAQPAKLWDYMVETERYGSRSVSDHIDRFTTQILVRALSSVFEKRVSLKDLFTSSMAANFSEERFSELLTMKN